MYALNDSWTLYSATDFHHKGFWILIFSFRLAFSQLPHFINSSLPAHDRMTAQQIDTYFRRELIYKRNERMARRVSALLQRNPNQTYFFAFGAGKGVSDTAWGMHRVRQSFSLSPSATLRGHSGWPLTRRLWDVSLNCEPNNIRIHHGSNFNLNPYFAINEVFPNTFWMEVRVYICM